MNDGIRKYENPVGDDAIEYINSLLTKEEREEAAHGAKLMAGQAKARKEKHLTQKELCGVLQ